MISKVSMKKVEKGQDYILFFEAAMSKEYAEHLKNELAHKFPGSQFIVLATVIGAGMTPVSKEVAELVARLEKEAKKDQP